jgi:curli biogenesis system outer membrane secretion channel CsgG
MRGLGATRWLGVACLPLLVLGAAGCEGLLTPQAQVTGGLNSEGMGAIMAVPYNGPRARIAVIAFDNQTAKGGRIGEGMSEMLVTELVNSNRFVVLERRELGGVLAEQDLGTSGKVQPGTEAPTGEIEGAEILVYGALTEFEPDLQGTQGTFANRKYGRLTLQLRQAHLALDLRLVDARTSRILSAVSITGRATDLGANLFTRVGGGSSRMGIGLAAYRNQPMEKAIRVCLAKAVQFVVSQTPAVYYRYDASGQPFVAQWPQPQTLPSVPAAASSPPAAETGGAVRQPAWAPNAHVSVEAAQVFARPDAASQVIDTLRSGAAVRAANGRSGWRSVVLEDGRRGWVLARLLADGPEPSGED